MKLRNIFLSLIAAAMVCNPLAAMYERPSYAPAIVCFAGATASGITAWWAHKKVKSLNALSDTEKSKPEIRKQIRRYTLLRNACTTLASIAAVIGTTVSTATYKQRQQVEKDNVTREQKRAKAQAFKARLTKKQKKNVAPSTEQQAQEAIIEAGAGDIFMDAAKRGDLAEMQNLISQVQGQALDRLVNTQDDVRKPAWHYVQHRPDIVAYQKEVAARQANNECLIGGCPTEKITSPSKFAVGSPDCLHFYCTDCLSQWRLQHHYCPAGCGR